MEGAMGSLEETAATGVRAGAAHLAEMAGQKAGEALARKAEQPARDENVAFKLVDWIRRNPLTVVAIIVVAKLLIGALTSVTAEAARKKE
jgi:hypothetical protein